MNIKAPSFSALIIAISFILLSIVIIQTELTGRDMEYSTAGIPLWKGRWRDLPDRYRVYLKIRGKISREEFPVPWFGPAPPAGEEQHPIYTDVYILEGLSGGGHLPEKVYLRDGVTTVMILADSGGNWYVGGRLISEWSQALHEEKIVEVEGYAFDVLVEGRRCTLFEVERVVDFVFSPLVSIFYEVHASGGTGGVVLGRSILVSLPVKFQVGRVFSRGAWTDNYYVYGRWMNSGETIAVSFNASESVHFQIFYSDCTVLDEWSPDEVIANRKSIQEFNWEFTAFRDGFYIYKFEAEGKYANITFDGAQVKTPSSALVFKELIDKGFIELSNPYRIDTSYYNVPEYEAVRIALEEFSHTKFVLVKVFPRYECILENGSRITGDFWIVNGYHNPPKQSSGTLTSIIVDKNGKIIDKVLIGWASTQ